MQPKKIIIIEDDKMLSTVFRMFLNQIGHELIGFYTSAQDAIDKIEEEKPDIVLMDILLPGQMNGIAASNFIKEKYNIPTIYISSSTDTDTLTNALKSNPYGYLLKPIDKYSLQVAIEIAIQKFEKEQEFYRTQNAITNIPFYAFIVDNNRNIIWQNKTFAENLKHVNKLEDFIPRYNKNFFSKVILPSLKMENKFDDDLQIVVKQKNINVKVNASIVKKLNNKIKEVFFLISEKKQSKKAQIIDDNCNNDYNTLKNSVNEALFFFNSENKLIDYNELAEKYANKLLDIKLTNGLSSFDIINFIDRRDFKSFVQNIFDGISHYLERPANINEKEIYFKISMFPFEQDNEVIKYCISLSDITWIKQIEEELNDTKDNLKPIFQSSIQRFYLLNLNYELVSFNNKAFEVIQREFRYNLKRGDNILKFVPKEIGIDKFKDYFEQAKLGNNISFKIRFTDENGQTRWNESHLDPVINDKGEIYRILLWTIDITESEQNILELEKSQKRYELVANGGNDGIWDWDIVNNEIYLSPRWKAVLGYDDNSLENKFGVRDSLIHPDDYIKSREILEDTFREKQIYTKTKSVSVTKMENTGGFWNEEWHYATKPESLYV
jgi:PAS domain-containing protein